MKNDKKVDMPTTVKELMKRDIKEARKFVIYCAELVLPLYKCEYNSPEPKKALAMARDMIEGNAAPDICVAACKARDAGDYAIALKTNCYATFAAANAAGYAADAVDGGGSRCINMAYIGARDSAKTAKRPDLITKMEDELKRVFESIK